MDAQSVWEETPRRMAKVSHNHNLYQKKTNTKAAFSAQIFKYYCTCIFLYAKSLPVIMLTFQSSNSEPFIKSLQVLS